MFEGIDSTSDGRRFFSEFPVRFNIFLRAFARFVTQKYLKEVKSGYGSLSDQKANEIKKSLSVVEIKTSNKKPRKDQKQILKSLFIYSLVTLANKKKLKDVKEKKNLVIRIILNKKDKKKIDPVTFALYRYSPWTSATIPAIPKTKDVTVLFTKVTKEEYNRTIEKNLKHLKKVNSVLIANKIKPRNPKNIKQALFGFEDLEYWAMRKELGIDTRKESIWKPALKKIMKYNGMWALVEQKELLRILIDMSYNYQKISFSDKIESNKSIEVLKKFQKLIMGR
jgi:hypothetical protein